MKTVRNTKLALAAVLAARKNYTNAKKAVDGGDAVKAIGKLSTAYHELFGAIKLLHNDNSQLVQEINDLENKLK